VLGKAGRNRKIGAEAILAHGVTGAQVARRRIGAGVVIGMAFGTGLGRGVSASRAIAGAHVPHDPPPASSRPDAIGPGEGLQQ
jgi:hypothetical protein